MLLALFLAVPAAIPSASWGQASVKPDFASVQTLAAAKALAAKGRLIRVLAFPSELGGPDAPENVVYITPQAADARTMLIGTITRMVQQGAIDAMTVAPEYKGDSIVPTSLTLKAHHTKKKGDFTARIDVW